MTRIRRVASADFQASVLLAAAALLLLAVAAVLVCPGGRCAVPACDAAGLVLAWDWRRPWLDALALGVTWLGSLYLLLPAALLLAWRDTRRLGARLAAFVPLALLAASAVVHLTKVAVLRPRPELFAPLAAMPADASFPSAHAMQIAAFVTAVLLRPRSRPHPVAWVAGAAVVSAVACSRIYLQVHFPSDVIAGVLAAVLLVLALRAGFEPALLPCRPSARKQGQDV
ncbi:MAG: phosphatase PAP2 family protein [Rhodocyclales bacterium]|nr:phosphatase PAP2 family protein [Rhodocyclales bacterium]